MLATIAFGAGVIAKACVDTGSLISALITPGLAKQVCNALKIKPTKLETPIPTCSYNGEAGTLITEAVDCTTVVAGHGVDSMRWYISPIVGQAALIGLPWMRKHNASISCQIGSLNFNGGCQHQPANLQVTRPAKADTSMKGPTLDPELSRTGKAMTILKRPIQKHMLPETAAVAPAKEGKVESKAKARPEKAEPVPVCLIGAAPFNLVAKQKGSQIFAISMRDIQEHILKKEEAELDPEKVLPEEFHQFLDVFSKERSNTLSQHRGVYDHHIELQEGTKLPPPEPLRRMTVEEALQVESYIQENLAKGFIIPSSYHYSSPILFVRKPSGGLRLCVDYRKLNAITKKDVYPLPLIDETISRLAENKWYTKLDIRQAFHKLRMRTEEDENLTTFATRLGNYKYRVLPFGLCGGPATFQRFMNSNFIDMLGSFLSIYLDDILIASKTKKEHKEHIEQVLYRLREVGLQADIKKCEFYQKEVKYLGLVISQEGIKMDPAKVATVKEWKMPRRGNLKDVRQFLGFVNYYRRFIKGFSKIAGPLHNLLKSNGGLWNEACTKAFNQLKEEISKEPVLKHFEPGKQCYVECDASDDRLGGVLSQMNEEGVLQPVAFFSKSLTAAERNYAIYDKELLAIVKAFEEWRPELQGNHSGLPTEVLTDHLALQHFMTTKKLSRRQARWAELLSQYHFQITYRPGAQNGKADALTRRDQEGNTRSKEDPNLYQTLLKPEMLSEEIKEQCHIATLTANDQGTLYDFVKQSQQNSEEMQILSKKLTDENDETPLLSEFAIRDCSLEDGLVMHLGKLAVPKGAVLRVIDEIHCSKEIGHPGGTKTVAAVRQGYSWPHLRTQVRQYIQNCHICRRAKPSNQKPTGLLQPLPIPSRPWKDISMDFVTGLPQADDGNDASLNVADRFSKERHYIPCKTSDEGTSTEQTAQLLIAHVWRHHGLPSTIVSDRGPQFISGVWKNLCQQLGIKAKLSTAYHPQSDGQTEAINKEMERYLRTFAGQHKNNWPQLIPMAEFAGNATKSEATEKAPFEITKGYLPRMSFMPPSKQQGDTAKERVQLTTATQIADHLQKTWSEATETLKKTQQRMTGQANKHRKDQTFHPGQKVWLSTKNLSAYSNKLSHKWIGPFTILEKRGVSYKLELPKAMALVHNVFHGSLLALDPQDPLPGQEAPEPLPIEIDGEQEWEVEDIVDVKKVRNRIVARVKWTGYDEDLEWYPIDNFDHAKDILKDFYRRHPTKPQPAWLSAEDI